MTSSLTIAVPQTNGGPSTEGPRIAARRRSRARHRPRERLDLRAARPDASRPPRPLVHASITLPEDEFETLRDLAQRRNTSESQVVRQALATESCLQRIVDRGGLILASFGRRAHEVVFSQL